MDVDITTLAERPELAGPMWRMPDSWPEFIRHDPVGWLHMGRLVAELPESVLVGTDDGGEVVARAFSVPLALSAAGRGTLPDTGWDQALLWAFSDLRHGRKPDTVCAVEITVANGRQGRGLSGRMLAALREHVSSRGFGELVAPVRPNGKHHEPHTPMAEYAYRVREEDGLPADPWLRVHVRAGGVIESVAPASMVVPGSLAQWREWTGLPFGEDGPVEVPGALVPVRCVTAHEHAVYVEPNVWVRHALG